MDRRRIEIIPLKTALMNRGKLRITGWNAHEFAHGPERMTTPLVRNNGKGAGASREEAVDFTVSRLKEIRAH